MADIQLVVEDRDDPENEQKHERQFEVTDVPNFDLETYINSYSGKTRLDRALFIARHCAPLAEPALKLALSLAKLGRDVSQYRLVFDHLEDIGCTSLELESDANTWIKNTERKNDDDHQKLELELKSYQNNMVRESIRLGSIDLAEFYAATGDFHTAVETLNRARKFVETDEQQHEINKSLLKYKVASRSWVAASQQAHKFMAEKVRKGPEKDMAHLTQALCNLKKGDYPACADSFLKIKSLTDDKYNEILSDNDVATYGTLCALAVLDPKRLKAKTLGSSSFRSFLELTPKLRRAVSAFCTGRFANCMSILEGLKNDYLLDIYLSDQVDELFTVIRKKCIKQYCLPFSVVKLKTLSDAFGVDGASVEEELIALIKSGEIDARIDLIEGTLEAVHRDARATLQAQTLQSVTEFETEFKRRILHQMIVTGNLTLAQKKTTAEQQAAEMGITPDELRRMQGGQFNDPMSLDY